MLKNKAYFLSFKRKERKKQFSWDALYDARILTLIIDSEKVYNAFTTLPQATPRLNTIKVAKIEASEGLAFNYVYAVWKLYFSDFRHCEGAKSDTLYM